jgi:hypothetical protein
MLRVRFADRLDLFLHRGEQYPKHPQVVSEWWILLRRVAGGLTSGQQRQLIQKMTPILFDSISF